MKKIFYIFLNKLTLRLHNFIYKLSSRFAIKAEDGIHPKHRLMNYHQFFIDNIENNDRVLDIGCGNGALAFDLAKKAERVVAIDMNQQNIGTAKEKYSSGNIEYFIGNVTNYNFPEEFNVAVLSNVLEHIDNRLNFLRKINDLVPKILIRVPMIDRDWITLYKKDLGVEWRLDPTHYIEYTLESLKGELKRAGISLEKYSIQFGEIWGVATAY
ncbi:MAG: class I SAM-dependent methyltransferase [Candidatus Scalindua sp.]